MENEKKRNGRLWLPNWLLIWIQKVYSCATGRGTAHILVIIQIIIIIIIIINTYLFDIYIIIIIVIIIYIYMICLFVRVDEYNASDGIYFSQSWAIREFDLFFKFLMPIFHWFGNV